MANRRIFYAIQSVGFSKYGATTYIEAHGVQSAGITTTFNLEQILELGQLGVYENVEIVPDIEFTAEKVLDGYPLLMHLATNGSPDASLIGRSNVRTTVALNIFGDTQQSASGVSIAEVNVSGLYWSNTGFTFANEGSFRETFSAVGNDKVWRDIAGGASMMFTGAFVGTDVPYSLASGSGGVQRREDLIFYPLGSMAQETASTLDANGQLAAFLTILPPDIPGISSSGTNDRDSTGTFGCHVAEITTGASLGRDALFELGKKGPYYRFVNWPVQVTTEVTITATKWDAVNALAEGQYTTGPNAGNNTTPRSIRIRAREGTFINCGLQNKLSGVTYGGGDTGGGNVSVKYTYQTYNDFTVTSPVDPSHLPWPF